MGLDRAATLSGDPTMTDEHEAQTLSHLDKIASMTDGEVRRAYLECEGQCGDAWDDALALACQEREINI